MCGLPWPASLLDSGCISFLEAKESTDYLCFLNLHWWYAFIDFREKEGRGAGEKERETLIGCLLLSPLLRTEPTSQVCFLTRNWTCSLLVCRRMPQPTQPPTPGLFFLDFRTVNGKYQYSIVYSFDNSNMDSKAWINLGLGTQWVRIFTERQESCENDDSPRLHYGTNTAYILLDSFVGAHKNNLMIF